MQLPKKKEQMLPIMKQTLTVDEVSSKLQALITGDSVLQSLNVKGEILEFKKHSSGHVYFSLAGENSRLSGVMFRSDARNIPQWPKTGDEVIVQGRISIYPARSTYQVYAKNIIPVGIGAAARAKEEIKKKLKEEGLFDLRLKRTLPFYPSRIAVITSPTGAAIRDVIKVAHNRFPGCSIIVVPTLVQGLEAPIILVNQLRAVNNLNVDAVMLVRGGGSRDDLNPFDDEYVVRALRNVAVPVITGLGHQVDLTLSDLAADVSAPTPSGAAELLLPDRMETERLLNDNVYRLRAGTLYKTADDLNMVNRNLQSLSHSLHCILNQESARVNECYHKAMSSLINMLHNGNLQLSSLVSSLNALSPLAVMERGFITCQSTCQEKLITSVNALELGEEYSLHFKDGQALTEIKRILPLED